MVVQAVWLTAPERRDTVWHWKGPGCHFEYWVLRSIQQAWTNICRTRALALELYTARPTESKTRFLSDYLVFCHAKSRPAHLSLGL